MEPIVTVATARPCERYLAWIRACVPGLASVWCLVGNGGMDYWDYDWGLYRGYCRDPFPHSLLSTREALDEEFTEIPVSLFLAGPVQVRDLRVPGFRVVRGVSFAPILFLNMHNIHRCWGLGHIVWNETFRVSCKPHIPEPLNSKPFVITYIQTNLL